MAATMSSRRCQGLATDPRAYSQERLTNWLASVAVSLREGAIRQALVNACRVLGHLGFDLILLNAGHLGQAQQVDRHIC